MLLQQPGWWWRDSSQTTFGALKELDRVPSLSSLLFNLALKALTSYFFEKAPLHGILIGECEIRTKLFGDDVLIFTANPSSMSTIKKIFDEFRLYSGIRISYSKSEILHLGILPISIRASSSLFL